MVTENMSEAQRIEKELLFSKNIEQNEITQGMINAAKTVDDSIDEAVIRKILEIGLPYRTGSLDDVARAIKGVPQDIIDDILDAAIAAIE